MDGVFSCALNLRRNLVELSPMLRFRKRFTRRCDFDRLEDRVALAFGDVDITVTMVELSGDVTDRFYGPLPPPRTFSSNADVSNPTGGLNFATFDYLTGGNNYLQPTLSIPGQGDIKGSIIITDTGSPNGIGASSITINYDDHISFNYSGGFTNTFTSDSPGAFNLHGVDYSLQLADNTHPTFTTLNYAIYISTTFVNLEASTPQTDIVANSLQWDVASGGVDYSYLVKGSLSSDTTLDFYWAPGSSFDPAKDTLAGQDQLAKGSSGNFSSRWAASSLTVAPPDGTNYLILVADPNNLIQESDETNNVAAVPYLPMIIFTGAKYNGNSSPDVIGRFFADPATGTPPITDETLTLKLTDSLAALRPTVTVGSYTTGPKADGAVSWDGQTYVTEGFDPGTLVDMATLSSQAAFDGQVIEEANSPRFHVVPLPSWIATMTKLDVQFVPVVGGMSGDYTFDGLLKDFTLSLPPSVTTLPQDVPFFGGQSYQASAGIGAKVFADLNPKAPAVAQGYIDIQFVFAGLTLLDKQFSTDKSGDVHGLTVTTTLDVLLDTDTFDEPSGVGVTVAISGTVSTAKTTLYSTTKPVAIPPLPPFLARFELTGQLGLSWDAAVTAAYHAGTGFEIVPNLSHLHLVPALTLVGDVGVGYFIPNAALRARLQRLYGTSALQITLDTTVTGTLGLDVAVTYASGGVAIATNADVTTDLAANFSLKVVAGRFTAEFDYTPALSILDDFGIPTGKHKYHIYP